MIIILLTALFFFPSIIAYQGVLHECVSVMYLTPTSYNKRRTARLLLMPCPDSTPMRLATLPPAIAASTSSAVRQNAMSSG